MEDDWLARYELGLGDFELFLHRKLRGLSNDEFGDILQDTLTAMTLELRKHPAKFATKIDILVYARKVAVNKWLRTAARGKRQVLMEPSKLAELALASEAAESLDIKDGKPLSQQIQDALAGESDEVREAMRQHLAGVMNKDIAKQLGISQAGVTRRLQQAKQVIEKALEETFRQS